MSLMLRNLFRLHRLMDEATDGADGSGDGGSALDIDKVSDTIGAELGLGDTGDDDEDLGSATPSKVEKTPLAPLPTDKQETPVEKAAREARERAVAADPVKKLADAKAALTAKKVDFTGKSAAEILSMAEKAAAPAPDAKPMARSWKKEMGEHWNKLDPQVQDYILQREAQVEEGFKQQAGAVRYANAVFNVMKPHQQLLQAQGINDHAAFLGSLVEAHYVLSSLPDVQRLPYMASILKTYGIDPQKVLEAVAALPAGAQPKTKTEAERALEARLAQVEGTLKTENQARLDTLKAQSAQEVEAFASDPAHPYFNEVAEHVSLLLADPRITLEKAYEMAVYANPVTRAKELGRLQQEAETKARKEADEAAAAALKARGTKVKGQERHRASPDLLGSMEDTMRETLKDIQSRS